MDFPAIAKSRVADLGPAHRQLIWAMYQASGKSLLDLAYSPILGRWCDTLVNRTGLEFTPGELYHTLGLLGAF